MIEIPGRIPIFIHPFFWVIAALIGWINSSGSVQWMFIWIGIIFFSVLIHEFGHALTSVCFRQRAQIQLVAMGGLTSYKGPKLKYWQQFLIIFNGPLFGFFIYLGAAYLLTMTWSPLMTDILKMTKYANLFWTVINLLPVIPMDGGQLLRVVLEGFFGVRGFKVSLLISALLSLGLAFVFFLIRFYLGGALFFLFAFQSFDLWRRNRIATKQDQDEVTKKALGLGEMAFRAGKMEEAKAFFEKVHERTKKGVLAITADQYLSLIAMKQGDHKLAYEFLLPVQEHLADDTKCLLHQLASEFHNDELVAKLSKECYQLAPTQEMALRNARSFARLKKPKLAGGWLQAAAQMGPLHLEKILKEEVFVELKQSHEFNEFVNKLRTK